MFWLILKRALWAIPVLWAVATITFVLVRIVPGGPFEAEKNLPPQIVANIKAKYHLDRPVMEQYVLYLDRLAHGDLGVSYKYVNRTVNDILREALPVSVQLGAMALGIAVVVGIPLGTLAAVRRRTYYDFAAITLSTVGISVPNFLVGALLIYIFGVWLKVLPVALWESARHMILPSITLSFLPTAYVTRLTRASMVEVLQKDWVRTARSKGLSYPQTIIRHVLRNSLLPVLTIFGPLTAILITGSFTVEYIYAIPGMGRFFITAVINRDYDLIMATSLIFALILIVCNTIVDMAYTLLDPRVRVES